jgi:uncharacterized membrane protein YbhN (UPF0104 family)
MKRYIKIFELTVSILVTVGFLYLFYAVIGFDTFFKFLKEISPENILLAFSLYVFSYITRAYRWKITLNINDFKKLFKITSFNTVFNIFLPFRTGELSFFYMLKKENIPFSESAVSFFTVRIFDAVSLFTVFGASFLLLKGYSLLAVLLLVCMPLFFYILKWGVALTGIEKLKNFSKETLHFKNLLVLYILSILTFVSKFTGFYFVLPKGLNLSFTESFFASSAGDLTTVLPIHGIAGIGTYEGGFAGVLIFLGIEKETALLASVFVHIFILLGAALVAGFSYIFLRK